METETTEQTEEQTTTDLAPKPQVQMTSQGLTPRNIEEAHRFATWLASSTLVPDRYRGNIPDCLVALDVAARLKMHWLAVMSHVYSVYGMTGIDGQATIAAINQSDLFTDPLDYEIVGDEPSKPGYKVRAYATRSSTGKVVYGPWITWQLVKGEEWDKKKGSKWLTMPEQMFRYRAASWFAKSVCPEATLGMPTTEELVDMPESARHVDSQVVTIQAPRRKSEASSDTVPEQPDTEREPDDENQAEPTPESEGPTGPDWPGPTKGEQPQEAPKDDAPKPLSYRCGKCGAGFMQPRDGKCPACLSKKIEAA